MNNDFFIKESGKEIRCISVSTSRFKTNRISVRFALPLDEKTVAANALLPMLLSKSSAVYPKNIDVEKKLALLYGADLNAGVSKFGDSQIIRFSIDFIADRFAIDNEKIGVEAAEFLRELIFNPKLDENGLFEADELNKEKQLQIESIKAEINNKTAYALKQLERKMFENEAYSADVKGTEDAVEKLTPEDLKTAWENMLEKSKVQISAIGDFSADEVFGVFEKAFDIVDRNPVEIITEIHTAPEQVKEASEDMPLKQGKLVMGWSISNKNPYALRVFNEIFGGGTSSKLFKIVREKMSLCYYCSARCVKAKGVMYVQSGIESENSVKAQKAIIDQLEAVKLHNFTEDDFKLAKLSLDDSFKSLVDTPSSIDSWYAVQMFDNEIESLDDYRRKIKEVTGDEVAEIAASAKLDTVFNLVSKEA